MNPHAFQPQLCGRSLSAARARSAVLIAPGKSRIEAAIVATAAGAARRGLRMEFSIIADDLVEIRGRRLAGF
jgi:hypothetical protein